MRNGDLLIEVFEACDCELLQCDGHQACEVGSGGDDVGQRLVQLAQALRECLLCLFR